MARRIIHDYTCPFCGGDCYMTRVRTVTALSVTSNIGWSQTKRGTKQYFHNTCYRENTIGAKLKREGGN